MPSKAKKLIEECRENNKNELSLVDQGLNNFKDINDELCKIFILSFFTFIVNQFFLIFSLFK